MAGSKALKTRMSTKGQVILPKAIRDRRGWGPGAQLVVEDTTDGVVLRQAPLFPPTRVEDVFGCLAYDGPILSIEEMDEAIAVEVKRRHAGD